MWIGFAEAAMFCNMVFSSGTCPLELYITFSKTVFFKTSDAEVNLHSLRILEFSTGFLSYALWTLSCILNIWLCWDLVFMIKFPFGRPKRRVRNYFISAMGGAIFAGSLLVYDRYHYDDPKGAAAFELALYLIFFLSAAISIIYAGVRLCKPGISAEVRKLIFKRHVTFISFYGFVNIYFLLNDFLFVLPRADTDDLGRYEGWLTDTLKIIFFS